MIVVMLLPTFHCAHNCMAESKCDGVTGSYMPATQVRRAHARLRARRAEVEEELKAIDAVRLRLRLLTGTCSASEGVRALRASAALGSAVATEREQLQGYVQVRMQLLPRRYAARIATIAHSLSNDCSRH